MAPSYDSAITVFSPDGHLFQVEYAQEAVKRGSSCVGVRGTNIVVLAVERKSVPHLQLPGSVRKIFRVDEHVALAYSGLTADARTLASMSQIECQSHRLSLEDAPTVESVTRFIAEQKQSYTQSNGRRPFGISCLICGFDYNKFAKLYTTDPSGVYFEFKANAIGRNSKVAVDYLETYYDDAKASDDVFIIQLALAALTEVITSDVNLISVVTITPDNPYKVLDSAYISEMLAQVEAEKKSRPPPPKPTI